MRECDAKYLFEGMKEYLEKSIEMSIWLYEAGRHVELGNNYEKTTEVYVENAEEKFRNDSYD